MSMKVHFLHPSGRVSILSLYITNKGVVFQNNVIL